MKKLYYILAVVLVVCGILSGCKKNPGTPEDNAVVENGGEEEESGYRFGYSTVDLESPYYQTMKKSLEAALGKENGELLVKDAQYDAQLQNSQIQELIEEEVDAVFVTPVDSETIAPALEELKKAGIPVINLDTKVKDSSLADAYIGADNKNAGYVCGEDLLKQCPAGGKIILMENPLIHAMNERVTGFERAIANEGFEVLSRTQVQDDRQQAKEKMQELLAAFPQIDAVMCATDEIALGVADALKESDRIGVKVYGVNGSPEAKAAIASGDSPLQGTGALSPIKIGQTAMDICFAILEEKEYESETEVETFLISSENVELYGTNGWQ